MVKLLSLMLFACATLGFAAPSFALNPQTLSVGGELFAPDGTRISSTAVNFRIEVRDATGTCALYSEVHLAQDLNASTGRFNLILGQGTSATNNVDGSAQFNTALFLNGVTTPVTGCTGPVARNSGDARQIRISYDLGSGYTALTPNVPLVASAYAMVADSVQGKAAADFIQVADNGSSALTQANTEYAFSATNWPKLQALLNGTSAQYLGSSPTVPVDLNGQRLVNVADPTAAQNAATKNYVDTTVAGKPVDVTAVGPMTGNGSVLKWDATANKWVAGTISTSATGTAGGDLQGSYPNPTIKNDAITAAKIASSGGGVNRLLITDASTGSTIGYGACAMNQVYAWTASGWACANVSALSPVTSVAGKTGVVTLNAADVGGLGTAALKDYGTAAGQLPILDGSGRLPAVDGSQLLNVNASLLQGRTVASTAPTPSQVLGWNALLTQWEPTTPAAGNSGTVTNVTSGTGLLGGPITTTGTLSVDVGAAAGKIVQENGSAQIAQLTGSAGAPAYTFAGNLNTGLFSPATNQLALTTNGSAALSILASGNVGLGTSAPTTKLTIQSANGGGAVKLLSDVTPDRGLSLTGDDDTAALSNRADKASYAWFARDTLASQIQLSIGQVRLYTDAGLNSGSIFTPTPRMTIVSGGNVGVGTTAPLAGLDVATTGTGGSAIIVPRDSTTNRPSTPVNGMIRYNNATSKFEAFENNAWANLIGGGGASFPLLASPIGSAAAPAYSFSGNANTGFYSPGTNQVAIATNGAAVMTVTASGSVGIGTTTPQSLLDVNGTAYVDRIRPRGGSASFPSYAFANTANFGAGNDMGMFFAGSGELGFSTVSTERLRISATGNVGVGTTAPQAGLDVATTGTAGSAIIVPRDSTTNRPSTPVNGMIRYNNATSKFEAFENNAWANMISSGGAAPTFPLLASPIGTAAAPAYSFSGNANAGMYSPSTNKLALATNGTAALTIAANGYVGIGSATPAAPLDVAGTIGLNGVSLGTYNSGFSMPAGLLLGGALITGSNPGGSSYVTLSGAGKSSTFGFNNAGANGQFRLGGSDAAAPVAQGLTVQGVVGGTSNTAGADFSIIGSQSTGTASGGGIVFQTSPAGSSGTAQNAAVTAMTIAGSGRVGIATSAPGATLDVNGGIRAGAATVVTATCAAANEGTQRYNYSTHAMEFCDGTNWSQIPKMVAGAAAPVTASGSPVNANIYSYTATANYTPAYGALANINNGTWLPNGTNSYNNNSCVNLYNGATASNQIITIDLGSVKTIGNVYATFAGDGGLMTLGLAFSADGTSYPSSTSLISGGNGNYVYYTPGAVSPTVTARYIRLTNGGSNNNGPYETLCQVAIGP